MSGSEEVLVERDGNVARLTVNRPEARNAMTVDVVARVFSLLNEIAIDESVHVLELTGAGDRFFCPGADLDHQATEGGSPRDLSRVIERLRIPVLLHEMPQITLAAINGSCAGAGLGWACACDLRVASVDAMFNVAFLGVGVAGDMGLPWSLPRLVGSGRARELFFSRGKFSAKEAQDFGLISAVYTRGTFREEVASVVRNLADAPWAALRTMKANFVAAERMSFRDYVDLESERHMRLTSGSSFADAARSFVENRPRN